jgi:hypothetical protein
MLGLGAVALLATGADHLEEYIANQFSSVPTIGTLFLLNFIAATIVGAATLLSLRSSSRSFVDQVRRLLAFSGIGIAASSLIGLWISETSSLFGFTEHGLRPAILAAIAAEAVTVLAFSVYLTLASPGLRRPAAA